MIKITKVYTRKGDKGQTKLAGNQVVEKHDSRIICIGDLDELNSNIGFAIEALKLNKQLISITEICIRIQHELFSLGAQLAVLPADRTKNTPRITKQHVLLLETEINILNADLASLSSFILPGGCEAAARIHLARSVCRRAERNIYNFNNSLEIKLEEEIMMYMNRLSDLLFVIARNIIKQTNNIETLWNYGTHKVIL